MNFDYWKGELCVYEKESVSVDEGEILTMWNTSENKTAFVIEEGYELVEEDDGYGKTIFVIQKVQE